MRLGLHVSIKGSLVESVIQASRKGCSTFQIFTRNPRRWKSKELDSDTAKYFAEKVRDSNLNPVFGHVPYLINLASSNEEIYEKSVESLVTELNRCAKLRIPYVITHLGSHLGAGKQKGLNRIVDALSNAVSEKAKDVMLLLENDSGSKNRVGSHFQDIQYIMERLEHRRYGVCFDTCHGFAAGYDLRTMDSVEETIEEFDSRIGLRKLKAIHLNDSIGDLNSNVDRHEHIGLGKIGEEGFRSILGSQLGLLPLILETPIDNRRNDEENLAIVREILVNTRHV